MLLVKHTSCQTSFPLYMGVTSATSGRTQYYGQIQDDSDRIASPHPALMVWCKHSEESSLHMQDIAKGTPLNLGWQWAWSSLSSPVSRHGVWPEPLLQHSFGAQGLNAIICSSSCLPPLHPLLPPITTEFSSKGKREDKWRGEKWQQWCSAPAFGQLWNQGATACPFFSSCCWI